MRIPLMRHISWYLIIAIFIIGITPRVEAGLAPSEAIAMQQVDRTEDLEKIQKVLEVKMVRERLEKFGLAQDEIQKRLENLSDQQIHQLALQLDDIKVGGDALGVLIGLLVIAILIVIFLQITGHRIIITK